MAELYAGLDVSLELTSVCVGDEDGRLVHEQKVRCEPEAIAAALNKIAEEYRRLLLQSS